MLTFVCMCVCVCVCVCMCVCVCVCVDIYATKCLFCMMQCSSSFWASLRTAFHHFNSTFRCAVYILSVLSRRVHHLILAPGR